MNSFSSIALYLLSFSYTTCLCACVHSGVSLCAYVCACVSAYLCVYAYLYTLSATQRVLYSYFSSLCLHFTCSSWLYLSWHSLAAGLLFCLCFNPFISFLVFSCLLFSAQALLIKIYVHNGQMSIIVCTTEKKDPPMP